MFIHNFARFQPCPYFLSSRDSNQQTAPTFLVPKGELFNSRCRRQTSPDRPMA